ncbi:hypothetical protein [Halorarum halobium]|uniref:hypothetical protein n=1 Tax=Halorarum halobium TaxID=3075121 RepID=UPI0028A6194B|nr:hypothetical protein [Halobaculum sp. XH14]
MRPGRRPTATLLGVLLSLQVVLGRARAHDLSTSRFDAPIPFPLLLAGAAATVLATAALLGRTGGVPTVTEPPRISLPARPVALARSVARVGFLLAVTLAVLDGLFGPSVAAENAVTVFVWPVWLRGLALLSVLVGSSWPTLSPWRTAYDWLRRLEGDDIAVLGEYPKRLARWPATVGFVGGVGVLATLTLVPQSPRATAGLVAGYAAVMLLGGVCFGPTWFRRADLLAVFYGLLGRVAVVDLDGDREGDGVDGDVTLAARYPWTGCVRPVADGSLVAFVVAAVYTVSFDGFTNTPEFQTLLFGTRRAFDIGPVASVLLYGAGLVGFLLVFGGVAWLVERVGREAAPGGGAESRTGRETTDGGVAAGGTGSWRGAALAFAPTVVPIAAAYEVAHNYPYVFESLGRLVALALRALGVQVGPLEPLAWLPIEAFWASQAVLVVVGHVVAVVAAHGVAVRRYGEGARRGHAPLLLLMVGYTVLSLWIVSRPVVSFG